MEENVMSYFVIVLCNNEIHYMESFKLEQEAQTQAILLANEWHNKDGIERFLNNKIETINDMKKYYTSEIYYNCEDNAHVVIEEHIL